MALTHGPRLGVPSASALTIWARFSAAATVTLEVRVTGTSTWTLADTQPVDTALHNTVVLIASGLTAATKYEYRLLEDGIECASTSTWTMPTTGRFVVFHATDGHGVNTAGYTAILAEYEENYEPLGIPGFIMQIGDLFQMATGSAATGIEAADGWALPEILEIQAVCSRLPFAYQFDDWDWAGNNSSGDNPHAFSLAGTAAQAAAAADDLQSIMWRDRPRPAAPSYAYSFDVCGVPFIVTDQRSQRLTNRPMSDSNTTPDYIGNESVPPYRLHGAAQWAWLQTELARVYDRALVVYISTGTLRVNAGTTLISSNGAPAARDGPSLYFTGEVAELARYMVGWGFKWRRNLVAWSGDDHSARVWDWHIGEPLPFLGTHNRPSPAILPFREFKSALVAGTLLGQNLHGDGNVFGTNAGGQSSNFVRWDITSTHGGRDVTARATFLKVADRTISTDNNGRVGDFYFDNGRWSSYVATADENGPYVSGTQAYPPENAPKAGIRFERSYLDDITGELVRESELTRDYNRRLRRADDLGELDQDDALRDWRWPYERDDLLPPLE